MIARMIGLNDIEKLAALSRINLTEPEKEELRKDMDSILGYVQEIQSVPTKSAQGDKPLHRNVFRLDSEAHASGIHTEILLKEAPARQGSLLKVKKIL